MVPAVADWRVFGAGMRDAKVARKGADRGRSDKAAGGVAAALRGAWVLPLQSH